MADIVFRYEEMRNAVSTIEGLSQDYANAASTFETDFLAAISGWEGTSKDQMEKFVTGPVMEYMRDTVSKLVNGLAELLAANADQMEKADQQIADNIPTSLG